MNHESYLLLLIPFHLDNSFKEKMNALSEKFEELKEIRRSNETEFVQMACSAKDPVFSTKSDTQAVKFNQSDNEDEARWTH